MMMRSGGSVISWSVICCVLVVVPVGCGSSSSATPTRIPATTKAYTDPNFNFGFRYPSTWRVPASGGQESQIQGVKTYILPIHIPDNGVSVEVTLDAHVIPFPPFSDGKVSPDPRGPSNFFHYYHRTVSGLPAMRVERWHAGKMDEVDTLVNTRTRSFDVRTSTAYPPYSDQVTAGYEAIVRTFAVPFS